MDSFFQRWKATIYFTLSTVLAFTAFSIAIHSTATHQRSLHHPPPPILRRLSANATLHLRRSGFSLAASLLLASPNIFFSSPNSTVFAVKDSFFSPASAAALPPLLNQLFQYHTSPLLLPMSEILSSPPGTCLPTLIHGKSLLITKIDGKNGSAEINGVKISHPDIVLDGSIVIHGVLKPFSSTDAADGGGLVPICDAAATNSSLVTDSIDFQNFKDPLHWTKIVRSLSSKGFVSFAIGLNSVLDGIRRDYTNLTSVTVFSPPDFGSSSSPVMDSVIRVHIVPRRISYKELVKIANTTPLKTLLAGHNLEVKVGAAVRNATSARLTVNGVEVLAPEIFSSDKYVVHGISRALGIANVSKTKKKKSSS